MAWGGDGAPVRYVEVTLHIRFSGRDTVNLRVVVNERQVLALRFGVGRFHMLMVERQLSVVNTAQCGDS